MSRDPKIGVSRREHHLDRRNPTLFDWRGRWYGKCSITPHDEPRADRSIGSPGAPPDAGRRARGAAARRGLRPVPVERRLLHRRWHRLSGWHHRDQGSRRLQYLHVRSRGARLYLARVPGQPGLWWPSGTDVSGRKLLQLSVERALRSGRRHGRLREHSWRLHRAIRASLRLRREDVQQRLPRSGGGNQRHRRQRLHAASRFTPARARRQHLHRERVLRVHGGIALRRRGRRGGVHDATERVRHHLRAGVRV